VHDKAAFLCAVARCVAPSLLSPGVACDIATLDP